MFSCLGSRGYTIGPVCLCVQVVARWLSIWSCGGFVCIQALHYCPHASENQEPLRGGTRQYFTPPGSENLVKFCAEGN